MPVEFEVFFVLAKIAYLHNLRCTAVYSPAEIGKQLIFSSLKVFPVSFRKCYRNDRISAVSGSEEFSLQPQPIPQKTEIEGLPPLIPDPARLVVLVGVEKIYHRPPPLLGLDRGSRRLVA